MSIEQMWKLFGIALALLVLLTAHIFRSSLLPHVALSDVQSACRTPVVCLNLHKYMYIHSVPALPASFSASLLHFS